MNNSKVTDADTLIMARQGHSFVTSDSVRVVYPASSDSSPSPSPSHAPSSTTSNETLIDVPRDGRTLGEIVTRGNIVMKEYFNDPPATRKAFMGGWFGSGDLAVWYSDGSLGIMDRSKDLIISGGR